MLLSNVSNIRIVLPGLSKKFRGNKSHRKNSFLNLLVFQSYWMSESANIKDSEDQLNSKPNKRPLENKSDPGPNIKPRREQNQPTNQSQMMNNNVSSGLLPLPIGSLSQPSNNSGSGTMMGNTSFVTPPFFSLNGSGGPSNPFDPAHLFDFLGQSSPTHAGQIDSSSSTNQFAFPVNLGSTGSSGSTGAGVFNNLNNADATGTNSHGRFRSSDNIGFSDNIGYSTSSGNDSFDSSSFSCSSGGTDNGLSNNSSSVNNNNRVNFFENDAPSAAFSSTASSSSSSSSSPRSAFSTSPMDDMTTFTVDINDTSSVAEFFRLDAERHHHPFCYSSTSPPPQFPPVLSGSTGSMLDSGKVLDYSSSATPAPEFALNCRSSRPQSTYSALSATSQEGSALPQPVSVSSATPQSEFASDGSSSSSGAPLHSSSSELPSLARSSSLAAPSSAQSLPPAQSLPSCARILPSAHLLPSPSAQSLPSFPMPLNVLSLPPAHLPTHPMMMQAMPLIPSTSDVAAHPINRLVVTNPITISQDVWANYRSRTGKEGRGGERASGVAKDGGGGEGMGKERQREGQHHNSSGSSSSLLSAPSLPPQAVYA